MIARRWSVLAAIIVAAAAGDALAATKLRDGFSNMVLTDGTSMLPRNPITHAKEGEDIYYWIEWKEPIERTQLRCVVKGPGTDMDDTMPFVEPNANGYSVCGMEDTEDADSGTYTFTQYLGGEMVGERSILIEKEPWLKGSFRKRWKTMLSILGAIIVIGYWGRRMLTGDKRSLSSMMGGEGKEEKAMREAVVIGSKVGVGATGSFAKAAAPVQDDAEQLRKLGMQFQTALAQPDKKIAVDIGRRIIGLQLKAGNKADAAKTLKECVAADPAFRLTEADQVMPLAKAALAAGDANTAVAAVRGFDKAFPGHEKIPEVYLFTAELLANNLKNTDMAKKILQHILAKHPGHFVAQEAKKLLQSLG